MSELILKGWFLTGTDQYLISGSVDNTIRLWSIQQPTCEVVLEGHTDWVMMLACPDPWGIAFGKRMVIVFFLLDGQVRCLHVFCNTLASGSDDQTIKIWDLEVMPSPRPCARQKLRSSPSLHHNTAAKADPGCGAWADAGMHPDVAGRGCELPAALQRAGELSYPRTRPPGDAGADLACVALQVYYGSEGGDVYALVRPLQKR